MLQQSRRSVCSARRGLQCFFHVRGRATCHPTNHLCHWMQVEYFVTDAFGNRFYNSCKVCSVAALSRMLAARKQHRQHQHVATLAQPLAGCGVLGGEPEGDDVRGWRRQGLDAVGRVPGPGQGQALSARWVAVPGLLDRQDQQSDDRLNPHTMLLAMATAVPALITPQSTAMVACRAFGGLS